MPVVVHHKYACKGFYAVVHICLHDKTFASLITWETFRSINGVVETRQVSNVTFFVKYPSKIRKKKKKCVGGLRMKGSIFHLKYINGKNAN